VVRAARERCDARLGVPAARRGSFGLGAALDGAGRGRRTLRRAVGWSALAPAARALLRLVSGRLRLTGRLDACCAGLMRPCAGLVRPGSELPYPGRLTPRRFLVVRAARERCGARLGVPAARRGSFGLGAASDGARRGRRTLRRAVGVCALAPATRALQRFLSGRLRLAGAGWARLARGSMRPLQAWWRGSHFG
jgi:hypothetical protein